MTTKPEIEQRLKAQPIHTSRLQLIPQTVEGVRAQLDAMSPGDRAHVSPDWLARLNDPSPDPWILGFQIVLVDTGKIVGSAGFKAPPADGMVEISYGIEPEFQGRGLATEAALALSETALACQDVRLVRAHTLLDGVASMRVLTKCGFTDVGEVVDPEDGVVRRWEKRA